MELSDSELVNGASPTPTPDDDEAIAVEVITDRLRDLIRNANGELERMDRARISIRERRDRYERALVQLTREKLVSKPPARPSKDKTWHISDERIEYVWQGFLRHVAKRDDGKISPTQLYKAMKEEGSEVSGETVRRAFTVLRERERVRIAGSIRGGGKLYAVMPTEGDEDAS